MLKRLIVGLMKGLVLGALIALFVVKGLGLTTFAAIVAYPIAIAAGVLTALIAGKPIWAADAKIEVALKAIVAAALAPAALFAIRKWLSFDIDLDAIGVGSGPIGRLPAVSLPIIAAFLGAVFELDNTKDVPATDSTATVAPNRKRLAKDDVAELADSVNSDAGEVELGTDDVASTEARRRH